MTGSFRVKVEANVGKPQVAYKETIRKSRRGPQIRQTVGRQGQYGHVKLIVEPNESGKAEFINKIVSGTIPKIPAIDQGIQGRCRQAYWRAIT